MKGKKYRKWYEKHKEDLESRKSPVIVHGYMLYECSGCGTVYKMYLEKGLEDRVQDKIYPEKHKPVPFAIRCKQCGGFQCSHRYWKIGNSDIYEELPEGASYFKNTPKESCGMPVLRASYKNMAEWDYEDRMETIREAIGRG
ncbi:MAG: zinc-ribbon domain protein [Bacteriophage sp.]|nr:MAG: zinc-ribbon domain protein [Bacteriophage sp.]